MEDLFVNEKEVKQNNNSLYKKIAELETEAESIKNQFESCHNYMAQQGIFKDAKRAVDYYEGRQWLDLKEVKFGFEKPQINWIRDVVDQKVSSINSKQYTINYSIVNDLASTQLVTNFSKYQLKEMGQEEINRLAALDGILKGTFIEYLYWNNEAVGLNGQIEGACQLDLIDVNDIALANPNERDVQKQEWIMYRTRESIKHAMDICQTLPEELKSQYIQHDTYQTIYTKDSEKSSNDMVYIYVKFFRQNGEIYFEKATENILIQEATPINPLTYMEVQKRDLEKLKEDNGYREENPSIYENSSVNKKDFVKGDDYTDEEQIQKKYNANLYPFIIESFYKRNNCIFGISLVVQMIAMQKLTNRLMGVNMMSALRSTFPIVVAKEGALMTTSIDFTKNGLVLTDRSAPGENGLYTLNTGTISNAQYDLAQNMIALCKDNFRASDVLDQNGNIPSGISGYALQQYTQLQDKPIEQWRQILVAALGKEARILEMFYKLFYANKKFSYEITDAQMNDINKAAEQDEKIPRATTNAQIGIFNGEDYLDTPFNVTVEVGEGAQFSEITLVALLDSLFLNGNITKLSTEQLLMWAEMVPESQFPKKYELKQLILQQQQSQVTQLTQQNTQLQAQMQALQNEFTNKVNQYNTTIGNSNNNIKNLQKMIQVLYNELNKQQAANNKKVA